MYYTFIANQIQTSNIIPEQCLVYVWQKFTSIFFMNNNIIIIFIVLLYFF